MYTLGALKCITLQEHKCVYMSTHMYSFGALKVVIPINSRQKSLHILIINVGDTSYQKF